MHILNVDEKCDKITNGKFFYASKQMHGVLKPDPNHLLSFSDGGKPTMACCLILSIINYCNAFLNAICLPASRLVTGISLRRERSIEYGNIMPTRFSRGE